MQLIDFVLHGYFFLDQNEVLLLILDDFLFVAAVIDHDGGRFGKVSVVVLISFVFFYIFLVFQLHNQLRVALVDGLQINDLFALRFYFSFLLFDQIVHFPLQLCEHLRVVFLLRVNVVIVLDKFDVVLVFCTVIFFESVVVHLQLF